MTIEQVTMYKSSDGTMFVTEKEALQHELKESLWDIAYSEFGRYDELIFTYKDDFYGFLKSNREIVLGVLE